MAFNYREKGDRRTGIDRRNFSYSSHIPERREEQDRRHGWERRGGEDRRSSRERRAEFI